VYVDAKAAEAARVAESERAAEVERAAAAERVATPERAAAAARAADAARVAEAQRAVTSPVVAPPASTLGPRAGVDVPLEGTPPPPEPSTSVFSSPWFWAVAGVLAASGGATAALLASQSPADPYAGTSGVLLVPSR
jgi:hypothetical protein